MSFISTTAIEDAKGEVRDLYQRQQGAFGYLPNYAKVFCHRTDVMRDWAALQATIRQEIEPKDYELIVIAAALAINNSYCALAHSHKLISKYYSENEVEAIVRNADDSPLSDAEKAMMRLSCKVAIDSSKVTQADVNELRGYGFSDRAIFNIVTASAARCFFAKIGDALGVQPDAPMGEMSESLREMLVVGRPISDEKPEVME